MGDGKTRITRAMLESGKYWRADFTFREGLLCPSCGEAWGSVPNACGNCDFGCADKCARPNCPAREYHCPCCVPCSTAPEIRRKAGARAPCTCHP